MPQGPASAGRIHTALAALLLGIAALAGGCAPGEVSSKPSPSPEATAVLVIEDGAFSIWMPAELELKGNPRQLVLGNQAITCYEYFARTSGVYWLARYCELPSQMDQPATQQAIIDQAQAFLMEEAHGRLVAQEDLKVDGASARRIIADSALRAGAFDGRYLALIAVAPNRLYLISTYGFNEADPSDLETMNRFVSSFRIHGE